MTMSSKLWGLESIDNIISTVVLKSSGEEGTGLGVFAKTWLMLFLATLGCFSVQTN